MVRPAALLSVLLLSSSVIVALEAVYSDNHDPDTLAQIRKAKAGLSIALNAGGVIAHVVYQATRDTQHVPGWKIACEWLGLIGYLLFTIPIAVCALSPTSDCNWAWFGCSIGGWLIACIVIIILLCADQAAAAAAAAAAAMQGQPPAPPGFPGGAVAQGAALNAMGVLIDVPAAAAAREAETVPLVPLRQSRGGAAGTSEEEGSSGRASSDLDSSTIKSPGKDAARYPPGGVPSSKPKKSRKAKSGGRG